MSSLTNTAITARKVIRYGVYFVVFVIIARSTILSLIKIYRNFVPDRGPDAKVEFGVLPELPFPSEGKALSNNLSYTIEILSETPVFPRIIEVYSIPKPQPDIQSLDRAKGKASLLGFNSNGQEIVETVYNFAGPNSSSLDYDIVNNIFSISSDLRLSSIFSSQPPDSTSAITFVEAYLKKAGLLPNDLLDGPRNANLLKIVSGQYVPAISLSETNLVRVNFFRQGLGKTNEYRNVTNNPNQANVWFMLVGGKKAKKPAIIGAEYRYLSINRGYSSTYPLKTFEEASQDLLNGNAYIANIGDNTTNNIIIRNAYVGYYDPNKYIPYYQPVIIFVGDEGFVAYVPAVKSEYYKGGNN